MITVRKAGSVYRADTVIGGERVRLSLGTKNHDAAQRYASRIEKALSEGPKSDIWSEVQSVLPEFTFKKLASSVGYHPSPPQTKPTWQDLKDSFDTHMKQQILIGTRSEATKQRYEQTFKEFDVFLQENGIVYLSNIDTLVVERFKTWRLERIRKRKQSRNGAGLVLEVAILHRIFAFAIKPRKWISDNPVEFIGKPGDPQNGDGGAEPFSAKQLTSLQEHAGEDLLAFMLLRWTGLRRSDAVALR